MPPLCDLCGLLSNLHVSYLRSDSCIYRLFSCITHRFSSFFLKKLQQLRSSSTLLYQALEPMPPLCDLCGLCGGKRLGRRFLTRKGHLNSCESSYIGMLEGNKKSPPPRFPPLSPPLWSKTARTSFPNEKGASEQLRIKLHRNVGRK
jgi:hypothetical protein